MKAEEKDLEKLKNIINEGTSTEENKVVDALFGETKENKHTLVSDYDKMQDIIDEIRTSEINEPDQEKVPVSIDPVNGTFNQLAADKLGISEEMAKMLEITPEDLLDIPESINDIDIPNELFIDNIKSKGIEDEEIVLQLLNIAKEYKATHKQFKKNINWYNKLPEKIRSVIDMQCAEVNNYSKNAKKIFAETFIESIINDAGIDSIVIDMQKSMEKAFDTSGITEYILEESKTQFEKSMEITMENTRKAEGIDEDKRQELLDKQQRVMDAFQQAYTFESFIKTIKNGKVRVKKFDIEKYKRHINDFYSKYEGDTPFIIKDPSSMAPVLHRHFEGYTPEQCAAFVIGFIKFTKNMNPNDVVDHTYMSYFISNVTQLDLVSHKVAERDFLNILSNNIRLALNAINNLPDDYGEIKSADINKNKESEENLNETE